PTCNHAALLVCRSTQSMKNLPYRRSSALTVATTMALNFKPNPLPTIPPLPAGEGRGEGDRQKESARPCRQHALPCGCDIQSSSFPKKNLHAISRKLTTV